MSLVLTAMVALAAQQTPQVLYTPVRDAADQKIKVTGWGSGTGSETDETAFEGAHSIRVSTRNYFQGAQMNFGGPVDLSDRFADRNNLLKFVVKTSDTDVMGGSGAPGGPRGGPAGSGSGTVGAGGPGRGAGGPGRGGPGGPGRGGPGGQSGSGGPPAGGPGGQGAPGRGGPPGGFQGGPGGRPGNPGGMSGAASGPPTLTTMRVIVTTTDGKKSEAYLPVSTSSGGERGWKTVAVPLQAINGFDRTNKVIQNIAFSGDVTTTFYVGDVRVVNDPTPIRGEIYGNRRSYNQALGDKVTFTGQGQGGASVLEYVWDFDDSDGTDNVDAIGQTITHQFRKASPEGKKTIVTLTIRDKYGLKPPAKATVEVLVNP